MEKHWYIITDKRDNQRETKSRKAAKQAVADGCVVVEVKEQEIYMENGVVRIFGPCRNEVTTPTGESIMSTTTKPKRKTDTVPKGMERLAEIVDRDCKRRSYEIALEMAKKQRAKKSPK